ncbi:unnamed protein product [Linum trigynum]|uniref:Uncharacterized protein n=1 Tax=Linum trigynum TaxID=586398 RepID=A0AAV2FUE4_9ROSI
MAASPLPKLCPPWHLLFLITTTTILSLSIITSSSQSHTTYIIHMDLTAMPKPYTDHHTWFLAALSSLPPPSTHIYTYTNSIHGFAAKLTDPQLHAIKSLPGYISSTPDRQLQLHTTRTPSFLGLDSLSEAFPAANRGHDVIIGFIDTGVWPESDSFRDDGMSKIPLRWKGRCVPGTQFNASLCNKKLIGASFFNKGLLASLGGGNFSVSMDSARDTDGHGTHTASTAAGSHVKRASYFGYAPGTARGAAPRARVAVYKVAWEFGTFASDVVAAVDQAIRDGVDVLSVALGLALYDETLVEDVVATATFAAVERGIFVAASAGNSGPTYATVINGAPWLTTVGAGSIDRRLGGVLTLGSGKNAKTVPFLSLYAGNFSATSQAMVFLDACASVDDMVRNRNKIIVCRDNSSIGTQTQNENAREANATTVFITAMAVPDYYMRNFIPAAYVDLNQHGNIVTDYIKSSQSPRGSLTFRKTTTGSKPNPRIDQFSARGPLPNCPTVLKPDIIAPGSFILASWSPTSSVVEMRPPEFSTPTFSPFQITSGTSMAAAHVAGVAALIKNVHPGWSPAAIRSALMTTASSVDNAGGQIGDASNYTDPADPFGFGSGHIVPVKAVEPGLVYDATTDDYVRLLCAMNFTASQIRVITRSSAHKCGGNGSEAPDLNYPSFVAYFNDFGPGLEPRVVVYEFRRVVTNVGDGAASYTAKLSAMKGVVVKVEPEKLVFGKKGEKLSYKLRVEGPKLLSEFVVQGSLSWVHDGGKYVVRSPIVATSLSAVSPFSGN